MDVAQLHEDLGALKEAIQRLDGRVGTLDRRMGKIEEITTFGRGIGWALLRIGVVIAAAIGLWEWFRTGGGA